MMNTVKEIGKLTNKVGSNFGFNYKVGSIWQSRINLNNESQSKWAGPDKILDQSYDLFLVPNL